MPTSETSAARLAPCCRSCGLPAGPRFCGHCGQELDARWRSVWTLLRHLLAEWFSLEGRLLHTVELLWRPGRLSLRYLDGKRASPKVTLPVGDSGAARWLGKRFGDRLRGAADVGLVRCGPAT